MTIREAEPGDALAIVSMVGDFLKHTTYGKLLPFNPDAVADLVAAVIGGAGVVLVAEIEGRLVGMMAIAALKHPVSDEWMGEELAWWVSPDHRHGSIGPKLLGRGEDWARQKGLCMLKMVAPAESVVGMFYERRGYVPIETAYAKRLA